MTEKLKPLLPCPFCGGEGEDAGMDIMPHIKCKGCHSVAHKDVWKLRHLSAADLSEEVKRVLELIGSIFYYGDFVAETANERELEVLLRSLGYFFEDEDSLIAKLHGETK